MNQPRILFITRKYPPAVGGMEKVSYHLAQELSKQIPVTLITWGKSQIFLPYFAIKAFFQALYLIPTKHITHIHLADGVLAPVGLALKLFTRRPVSATIHGLEVTYRNPFYQLIVIPCLRPLNRFICISSATRDAALRRGLPAAKCTVIPWGVRGEDFASTATRANLEALVTRSLHGQTVLVTVGRLVPRKGVAWFVREVMPRLGGKMMYLVVGEGSEREAIEAAVARNDLGSSVLLLGKVSDSNLKLIYRTADVFVMPNQPVSGDMEGFGIVALEAASTGLPVVASNLEGITDAILPGQTGELVEPGSVDAFVSAINQASKLKRQSVAAAITDNFSWPRVAKEYLDVLS